MDRVYDPGIHAGTEVTGGAGLLAITARLRVPEQRLTQPGGGGSVLHEVVEVTGQRYCQGAERRWYPASAFSAASSFGFNFAWPRTEANK